MRRRPRELSCEHAGRSCTGGPVGVRVRGRVRVRVRVRASLVRVRAA